MKSLLVDALRKASDQGGSSAELSSPDEKEEAAPPVPSAPDSEVTASDEAVVLPVLKLGEETSPDEALAAGSELALAPEHDAMLAATDAPVGEDTSTTVDAPLEAPVAAVQAQQTDWLSRAARWSPLLYVLALSSAAASYYGYQRLALVGVSNELGSMPTQLDYSDTTDSNQPNAWTVLPDSNDAASAESPPPAAAANTQPAPVDRAPPRRTETRPPVIVNNSVLPTLQQAYTAYGAADYARAEQLYRQVLAAQPFHAQALAGLAASLQSLGKLRDAALTYEELLKVEPGNVAAAASLVALVEQDWASGPSTETQLKLLVQRHPRVPEINAALGKRFADERRWPEAYEAYLAAAEMHPARADYHYNAAVCAENLGRVAAARDHYAAALQRSTQSAAFDVEHVAAHLAALNRRGAARP